MGRGHGAVRLDRATAARGAVLALVVTAALAIAACSRDESEPTPPPPPSADLEYHADRFSFAGRDGTGAVVLALDAERGRAGETFQTRLSGLLWDEREGWQSLRGLGDLPNPDAVVRRIPDVPGFRFTGSTRTPFRIESPPNDLVLEMGTVRSSGVGPGESPVVRTLGPARFVLGSAAATLRWHGREIPGRVLHETLVRPGRNPLVRAEGRLPSGFRRIRLLAGEDGDVDLHEQGPGPLAELTGRLDGFARIDGETTRLEDAGVETAPGEGDGLAWSARWTDASGEVRLRAEPLSRREDGLAAIVRGTLARGGLDIPVLGLAERLE